MPCSWLQTDMATPAVLSFMNQPRLPLHFPSESPSKRIKTVGKGKKHLTIDLNLVDAPANTPADRSPIKLESYRVGQFQNVCTKVIDGLYMGGVLPARDFSLLKNLGVTHILNCGESPNCFPDAFCYKNLNLRDTPTQVIKSTFDEIVYFVDSAIQSGGACYCHCEKGISRSSTAVICYLMGRMKMDYSEAFDLLASKRDICSPNSGFIISLMEWKSERS